MFRVGRVDEPLPSAGISHIAEHLALSSFGSVGHSMNGRVEATRTLFMASGTPGEVSKFLVDVASRLHDLPFDRLETETRILRAEAASSKTGTVESLLALRYGASGFGQYVRPEYGLNWLGAPELMAWSQERFCTNNAAVWLTFAPPEDLEIALPAGTQRPLENVHPVDLAYPAVLQRASAELALSLVGEWGPALAGLSRMLRDRLQSRLRDELGISYQAHADYQRLESATAHLTLAASTTPDQATELVTPVLGICDSVCAHGTTAEEIETDAGRFERALNEPGAIIGLLDQRATAALIAQPWVNPRDLIQQLRTIHPETHGRLMNELMQTSLWLVPTASTLPPGRFHSFPEWSTYRLTGQTLRPDARERTNIHPEGLVLAHEGLTYVHDEPRAQIITIRYADCVALLRWDGGQRGLIDSDGSSIQVLPTRWRKGSNLDSVIDSHVRQALWVPMGNLTAPSRPQRHRVSNRLLAWIALFAAVFAGGGVQNLSTPQGGGKLTPLADVVLTTIVAIIAVASVALIVVRQRRAPHA
jgi:predicted Zn-dependent peptidase